MKTNSSKKEYFDTAIVGGGAAGIMAAIRASLSGGRVALIEKNSSLGKKLLLTGNGRCNITQTSYDPRGFIEKIGPNGKFLFSSLSALGPRETMEFFENFGLKVKTEKDGRAFPLSDRSADVLDILTKALKKNEVTILLGQNVLDIKVRDKKAEYVETENKKIHATSFILTTGGKSYPTTGSTGDGYRWLEHIGHSVVSPTPALAPLRVKESWVKDLSGLSLKDVGISLVQNNQRVSLGAGQIIFTHFGLSGPAIINASKHIGKHLKQGEVFLALDLCPTLSIAALEEKLKKDFEIHKKRNVENYLTEILPQRLAKKLTVLAGIGTERKIYSITKPERTNLAKLIKKLTLSVETLLDFNHAMVTSGGVSLKEVEPKTMRSKIVSNLYLAGEILDLDGPTGGYNLQIAWTTGYAAGAAAELAK